MTEVTRQPPTPTSGNQGSDLRSVANQIEGLLDDDGHFNPNKDQVSRGHPDYDETTDPRTQRQQARDGRGRFRKTDAQPASDDTQDSDTPDLEADSGQDVQEDVSDEDTEQLDASDTEEEQTRSATEEAEADEEGSETEPIRTLAELADALEVPLEELQKDLTHTFRAAGEEVTVDLAELVAGYQKDADYRRQTGELANARRQAEQDYAARMGQFEQQHVLTAHMMNTMEKMLSDDLNSDKLNALRGSDPAEWTARREEIGQRIGALQQVRQYAKQQYDQFRTDQLKALKDRESAALMQKMPDFGQDHVQIARQTMSSLGMSDPEVSDIFDHRLVLGALELATLRQEVKQLREEKRKAKDTVKRVKKTVPKFQKPGKQRRPQGRKALARNNVARLRQRAAKSGTVDDAAKVIESMME